MSAPGLPPPGAAGVPGGETRPAGGDAPDAAKHPVDTRAAPPDAAPGLAGEARSFPDRKRVERGAVLAFAVGTLALTATLGLRTAVFAPDYGVEDGEFGSLAVQGAAELIAALLTGAIALWPRRPAVGKGLLIALTIVVCLAKGVLLAMFLAIAEPPEGSMSPGTLLLCWLVTLPLWLSFFPVLSAVGAARASRALDGPLNTRAAVSAWLLMVGLVTLVLGPDILVRFLGLVTLGGAALWASLGAEEERRLHAWVRGALTQGAPVYEVREGAPADEIPSVYASDAREATVSAARQDSASYRREPERRPVAAVDPTAALAPRSFFPRLKARAGVSVLVAALASAFVWPFLHGGNLPPRRLALEYNHARIEQDTDFEIPGLTLWSVDYGGGSTFLTGFDPARNVAVEGDVLFHRARSMPVDKLARFANRAYFRGPCCVVSDHDRLDPQAPDGPAPTPPFVDGGKLVFWRRHEGRLERLEVAIDPEMVSFEPATPED